MFFMLLDLNDIMFLMESIRLEVANDTTALAGE